VTFLKKEKSLNQIRLIYAILFITGVVTVLVGLVFVNNQMEFVNKASSAEGIIIGINEDRGNNGRKSGVSYSPIVKFQLKDGRTQTFTSSVGSNPPSYEIGSTVEVLYDPENPQHVEINSFKSLWLLHAVFLSMGAALIIIAVWMRNKKSLGTSYSFQLSGKEIVYLFWRKKICPSCKGMLTREKKKVDLGVGASTGDGIDGTMYTYGQRYRVKYLFRCNECGKTFELKRLAKIKE